MKNFLNLIFNPKTPINGFQYFIINLVLWILSFLTVIGITVFLGFDLIDTLVNYDNNLKNYLLVLIISEAIFFIPTILILYKRIIDTNLNIYWFYWLCIINFCFDIYLLLSYFSYNIFNDNLLNIISLISIAIMIGLIFIKSKNKSEDEIKENIDEKAEIETETIKFFPVKSLKFILMSVSTFGFYQIYRFYKNFKYIKGNYDDSKKIWPLIRSIFSGITSYFFLKRLFDKNVKIAVGIAVLYFFLASFWRVDNIYGIIGFFSHFALLPAVYEINKINNSKENPLLKNNKKYNFNLLNYIYLVIMIPIVIFFILSIIYIFPSGQNIKGTQLWSWQKNYLIEKRYIEKANELKYFYSDGFYNIKGAGIIITDNFVSIYSNSQGEEPIYNKMFFKDIESFRIEEDEYFTKTLVFLPKNNDEQALYIILDGGENYDKIINFLKSKIPLDE